MRAADLTPPKRTKPLTYVESLQVKLRQELSIKPAPKFTALEWAIMEGGGSLEEFQLPTGGEVTETVFGNPKIK